MSPVGRLDHGSREQNSPVITKDAKRLSNDYVREAATDDTAGDEFQRAHESVARVNLTLTSEVLA
ncbi:hypothetical protein [Halalkalicoccus subterraneus]|uniref:hypothetical protein n=1 Tax=Halalkalicoccus subterraneus TaxID=2675002 RepID=UPI000EFAA3DE|nr:hypothetical protein [Halalkalicoccus subterraneus]